MNLGKLGRGLTALVVIGALGAACTPDPGPTPSPTPSGPSTPVETEQERQERVAYEAAEKSYRAFRAEYNRVLKAGGAKRPTNIMKENAGGPYLSEVMKVAEAYKGFRYRRTGEETNAIHGVGFASDSLALEVCEDTTAVKTINRKGKSVGSGEVQKLQIEVKLRDQGWKVWSGTGEKVDSCD